MCGKTYYTLILGAPGQTNFFNHRINTFTFSPQQSALSRSVDIALPPNTLADFTYPGGDKFFENKMQSHFASLRMNDLDLGESKYNSRENITDKFSPKYRIPGATTGYSGHISEELSLSVSNDNTSPADKFMIRGYTGMNCRMHSSTSTYCDALCERIPSCST